MIHSVKSEDLHSIRPNSAQISPSPANISEALLENLHAELIHCALLTGTTASIALAICSGERANLGPFLTAYLPPVPTSFPVLVAQRAAERDSAALIDCMRDFYDRMTLNVSVTRAVAAAVAAGEAPAARHMDVLGAGWQSVAAAGVRALGELGKYNSNEKHVIAARKARLCLEGVCRGEEPCIDGNGRITVPVLAERRSTVRTRVNAYIFVERGNAIHRVLVLNATHRGFGASGIEGIASGESLRVLWKPGRKVEVVVSWVSDEGFGAQFAANGTETTEFVEKLLDDTEMIALTA